MSKSQHPLYLVAALMFTIVLSSCQFNEAARPSGPTVRVGETLEVSNLKWNGEAKVLTFRVGSDRLGSVEEALADQLPMGTAMALRDESGRLRFEMASGASKDGSLQWARERTESDELLVIRRKTEERVTEEYWINGDHLLVSYPTLPDGVVARAAAHYQAGRTAHLEEYPELIGAFSAFENYYDAHLANTLHNNPDGDDLAAISTSEEMVEVTGSLLTPETASPRKVFAYTCSGATLCAFLKCRFGGLLNSLCTVCGVVTLLCMVSPFIVP